MSINIFFTQQTTPGNAGNPVQTALGSSSGTGLFAAVPGSNFMDLIFARLKAGQTETPSPETTQDTGETLLQTGTIVATGNPDYAGHIEPLPLASLPPTSVEAGPLTLEGAPPVLISDVGPETPVTPGLLKIEDPVLTEKIQKKFHDFLSSFLHGLPQENKPPVISSGLLTPEQHHQMLQFAPLADLAENPPPALIATGITLEDIRNFIDDLVKQVTGGEVFLIGTVRILPPQAKQGVIFQPRALILPAQKTPPTTENIAANTTANTPESPESSESNTSSNKGTGNNNIAARLNALINGTENGLSLEDAFGGKNGDFSEVLKILEQARKTTTPTNNKTPTTNKELAALKSTVSAGLSTVPTQTPPGLSNLFSSAAFQDIFPEGLDWTNSSAGPSLSLNGTANMTSLLAHTSQAGQPHPATQMVAATISRAVSQGDTKNITVKLNPPELGKVEVRFEFSEHKPVRAVVIAEKPETYMMLQRDAHVLERALQESGLDTDGNSISFELSQDGSAFNHDNDGKGNHNGSENARSHGNGDNPEDDGMEIIETTMNWQVNPQTGHMHYNVLV